VVAKVNGEEITVADIAQLKENYQNMLGGQISLAQLGGNKRFLDGLIRDFRTEVVVGSVLCVALATAADLVLVGIQRIAMPWARKGRAT